MGLEALGGGQRLDVRGQLLERVAVDRHDVHRFGEVVDGEGAGGEETTSFTFRASTRLPDEAVMLSLD